MRFDSMYVNLISPNYTYIEVKQRFISNYPNAKSTRKQVKLSNKTKRQTKQQILNQTFVKVKLLLVNVSLTTDL